MCLIISALPQKSPIQVGIMFESFTFGFTTILTKPNKIWSYQGCDYLDYRYMKCDAVYFNEWEETSWKLFSNVDVLYARLNVLVALKTPPSTEYLQCYRFNVKLVSSNTLSFPHSLSPSRMCRQIFSTLDRGFEVSRI
jgi:hypothetical protein